MLRINLSNSNKAKRVLVRKIANFLSYTNHIGLNSYINKRDLRSKSNDRNKGVLPKQQSQRAIKN